MTARDKADHEALRLADEREDRAAGERYAAHLAAQDEADRNHLKRIEHTRSLHRHNDADAEYQAETERERWVEEAERWEVAIAEEWGP